MYDTFAKETDEEGLHKIAELFRGVGKIEKEHANRYKELLDKIDALFEKEEPTLWRCMNCGHEHNSLKAP